MPTAVDPHNNWCSSVSLWRPITPLPRMIALVCVGLVKNSLWHDHIQEQAILRSSTVTSASLPTLQIRVQVGFCFGEVERRLVSSHNIRQVLLSNELPCWICLRTYPSYAAIVDGGVTASRRHRSSKPKVADWWLSISYIAEVVELGAFLDKALVGWI